MEYRHNDFGWIDEATSALSDEAYLKIFTQTAFNRYFEYAVAKYYENKNIKCPIYLSVGQEHIPATIYNVVGQIKIFAQHRAHSYYLSFGGNPKKLVDELLHRPSGCAKGMGGSASIHCPDIGMYGHSGLMGDQVPIAVGYALVSRFLTMTVFGDASAEEDYVLGALGFAATKKAPILFICEDNDLSILTKTSVRRSWNLVDVAKSFGINSVDIADDPLLIAYYLKKGIRQLPYLINIRTCRILWHAGTGCDGDPEWNRYDLMKSYLIGKGFEHKVNQIEHKAEKEVNLLWETQLQIS